MASSSSDSGLSGFSDLATLDENIRNKFLTRTDSKSFHKGVKAFLSSKEATKWDARSLFPGEDNLVVANKLADFFNGISMEYDPLDLAKIPRTFDREPPTLTREQVAARLKKARKTTSRVEGDIFAALYLSLIHI